jgi:DNA-binding transcriptional LysR family regulator
MDLDALSLRQLRYLVTVADEPTFTDAAAALGISQSALSQAMARIETLTGEQLFAAFGRTRRLTQVGEVVVARARQLIGIAGSLRDDLAAHGSGTAGRLAVGMVDAAALYLVPDAVTVLKQTHPDAEVHVTVASSTRLIDQVVEHELDVAVVIGPVAADLDVVSVVHEPLHVFHGAAGSDPDQWVLYPAASHTRRAIDLGLAERGIAPLVIAESSNPAVLSRLAVMEGASTVLPVDVASANPDLIDDGVIAHRRVVAVRRHGDDTPLVDAFLAEVTQDS